METERQPEDHLPLHPNWFHILVAVADRPLHGYGIMQEVEERTDGRVHLWPATLYGSIQKMEGAGLLEATDPPDGDDPHPRRKYYGLTRPGLELLAAETRRLAELVETARSRAAIRDLEQA